MVQFFVVVFELLCGTCGGGVLILRQRNLSKQCLLRFLCLNIKIFTACALKRFNDCNIKLDHAEPLPLIFSNLLFRQLQVAYNVKRLPSTAKWHCSMCVAGLQFAYLFLLYPKIDVNLFFFYAKTSVIPLNCDLQTVVYLKFPVYLLSKTGK